MTWACEKTCPSFQRHVFLLNHLGKSVFLLILYLSSSFSLQEEEVSQPEALNLGVYLHFTVCFSRISLYQVFRLLSCVLCPFLCTLVSKLRTSPACSCSSKLPSLFITLWQGQPYFLKSSLTVSLSVVP